LALTSGCPERDAQFEYINCVSRQYMEADCQLSLLTRRRKNTGNFKNGEREHTQKGEPVKVLDHDFPIKSLGKATLYLWDLRSVQEQRVRQRWHQS
jgi:hypothetical protein